MRVHARVTQEVLSTDLIWHFDFVSGFGSCFQICFGWGMQEKLGDCVTRHFVDNVVFVDVRHYAKRLLILFELDDKNKLITKEKKERSKIRRKRQGKRKEKEKTGAMQSEQPCAIFLLLLYG